MVQESYLCSCDRPKPIHIGIALSNVFLVFILGLLNLPFGISHIASVIETDGASGNPIKPFPRGPTVAPYPSPETLDQFVQSNGDDDSFFNPAEALRNLLSLSSSNRVQGLKRVSQFHGNVGGGVGHYGLMGGGGLGTYYQQSPHLKSSWDSDENGMMEEDEEDEKPTFVPFIGARALTNIPQFFEHLKENIEALKVSPDDDDDSDQDSDDTSTEDNNQDARLAKPAARRTKTELLVDENRGRSTPNRQSDGASGNPIKPFPRGPTVAPYPSPETLDQFVQSNGDDDSFFNPAEALRNLLSLSSSNRVQGLKRVSQFHGNVGGGVGHYGLMGGGGLGTYYQQSTHLKSSWDSDENGMMEEDEEDEKPTFVPFIGARALTNIPQFFEHLKENIEALKVSPDDDDDSDQDSDDTSTEDNNQDARLAKPAARRTKTELLVDENRGRSTPNRQSDSTLKQSWKPRAAGIVHYYAPKSNFLESHQNMLRRANNYNPAWLYTNLGLGKRRR